MDLDNNKHVVKEEFFSTFSEVFDRVGCCDEASSTTSRSRNLPLSLLTFVRKQVLPSQELKQAIFSILTVPSGVREGNVSIIRYPNGTKLPCEWYLYRSRSEIKKYG